MIAPALAPLRSPDGTTLSAPARIYRLLSLEKSDVWSIVVYAVAIGLLTLAVPVAVQALVNTVGFTALLQPIVVLTVIVFLGLLGAGILRTLQSSVVEVLQQRLFVRAAHDLASRLPSATLSSLAGRRGPDLVNRFFDVALVQKTLASLLVDALSVVLQALVAMLLLAFYHPILLAFDVVLMAAIAAIVFGVGRKGPKTSIDESKAKYETVAWLEEVAAAARTFKSPGSEQYVFRRADKLARKYVHARKTHFVILLRQIALSHGLQAVAVAGLLGLGGALVMRGQLSVGQLVAAELVVNGVVSGLTKFGKHLESYYDLVASVDKVGTLVDLPQERTSGIARETSPDGPAELVLSEVTLQLDGRGAPFAPLSLAIEPGAAAAIYGRNGSGKSALADLLHGVHLPSAGRVVVDGLDTHTLSLRTLRREVAVVRDPTLFDGTILDNVVLGRPEVTTERALSALERVGLLDDVAAWPLGLETKVGGARQPLTTSQTALLALARALAGDPRLLVVDEVMDALDGPTVERLLVRLQGPQTLLVLTAHERVAGCFAQRVVLEGVAPARHGALSAAEVAS
jgi:putative ABC transport system ATP-binding protein